MELFSFCWTVSPTLDVMVYTWSYCSRSCCVCLMSLGGLHFSERRWGSMDLGERGDGGGETGRGEGRDTVVEK